MTKIIVCSDSHGSKERLEKLIENNNFDFFFFLGDGLQDLGLYQDLPNVLAVKGNCDFFSTEQTEILQTIADKRILALHGNSQGVKLGMGALIKYAKIVNADLVLFGHTHNFFAEEIDGIWFFNPASLKNGNAMLIEIEQGKVSYNRIIV